MASNSRPLRLGTVVFLAVLLGFMALVAVVTTSAFFRARQDLAQSEAQRAAAERWRVEASVAKDPTVSSLPVRNVDENPELQRLRSENIDLRNEVAQTRAQLRAWENTRSSTVRTYNNAGPSRGNPSSRSFGSGPVGSEKPPRVKEDEERFLAENKTKPGVVTLPSGLQYKIIWPGFGRAPKVNEMVNLNFRGTLIDGTEIDGSYFKGEPSEFYVSNVIAGWKEALLLMPAGAKWQVFIPSELAYGERGLLRRIPGNATLIYELELVSIRDRTVSTSPPAFISGFEEARPVETFEQR